MAARPTRDEAHAALMQSQMLSQWGMNPVQASMQTAMLPQIMQMKQAELMQKLATDTRKAYLERFKEYYQFDGTQIESFRKDFRDIRNTILNMIPDSDGANKEIKVMYESFLESYPEMYLQLIPKEILQAKLSQKCSAQNKELREIIPQISASIVDIMRKLAGLQETLGVSPLVSTVMGEMPDPIALMTNPQYAPYKKAMKIFQVVQQRAPDAAAFQADPIAAMKASGPITIHKRNADGTDMLDENGRRIVTEQYSADDILAAVDLLTKTQMGSACAPYGPEFTQKGPKPNKNAAACLASGPDAAWSTGNVSDPKGSKQLYHAQRLPDGSIDWVLTGDMAPVVAGFPGMPDPTTFAQSGYNINGLTGMPGMVPGMAAGGFYQPQPKARKSKKSKSASKSKSKSKK